MATEPPARWMHASRSWRGARSLDLDLEAALPILVDLDPDVGLTIPDHEHGGLLALRRRPRGRRPPVLAGARGTSAVNWPSGPTVRLRAICPVVTFRTDSSSTLAIAVRGRISTMSAGVSTR